MYIVREQSNVELKMPVIFKNVILFILIIEKKLFTLK